MRKQNKEERGENKFTLVPQKILFYFIFLKFTLIVYLVLFFATYKTNVEKIVGKGWRSSFQKETSHIYTHRLG